MNPIEGIILFTISVLPVVLIGTYIYKKDRLKEPVKLLLKLFISGIGSSFLVILVSLILSFSFPMFTSDTDSMNLLQLFFYAFFEVALVEEFCKWIMVYLISYYDDGFDELYDAILYCVFVALGFAFFENLLYVYNNNIGVGIARALLAVPGHACDGLFMGYYLGLAKSCDINGKKELKNKKLLLSILMPTITHGIYDFCLFTGIPLFILFFFIYVICMYIYVIKRIKKISSINHKIKYKDNYCPNCGHQVVGNFCPTCGRKNE